MTNIETFYLKENGTSVENDSWNRKSFCPTQLCAFAEKYHKSIGKEASIPVADIRNKLTPMSNLITMLENGLINADIETHKLVQQEIKQCKISIEYLSRKENKE